MPTTGVVSLLHKIKHKLNRSKPYLHRAYTYLDVAHDADEEEDRADKAWTEEQKEGEEEAPHKK